MHKQSTRHRRVRRAGARTVAIGVAMAALVAIVGAGQALATPDERVLERQARIDRHTAAGQADEHSTAEEPTQGSPAETRPRFIRPEPKMKMEPGPWIDDPTTAPHPDGDGAGQPRRGLVIGAVVAALLLAVGAATTWRVRHRRHPPEPTTRPEPTT